MSFELPVVQASLTGKVVLVSGGGGSIGAELCRQIARLGPHELVIFEQSEYNLYRIEMELRQRYPDLRVSLTLDDRVVDMVEGGFDLTLRIRSSLKDSTLRARRIGGVQVGIFAAPAYLAERGTPTNQRYV